MDGNKCDFCSNEIFSKQGIIENDIVRIIYPLKPIVFAHFMVITKRHAELFTDLNDTELVGMRELILNIWYFNQKNRKGKIKWGRMEGEINENKILVYLIFYYITY